ncbi:hypothetical protein AMS62_14250 [Bacillus sp. FJAT-18019]|nr:hypothetical protein AMS62_14250 [Bacillus sp. FJAT-18019]
MMRVLKYDWKRNSTTLLGAFAILLILQIGITVLGTVRNWELGVMIVLSMLAYASMSVLLLVVTGKTFGYNIKAYHRRLLPVRSVWSVVSSLILACANLLVLGVLMALHIWYYGSAAGFPWEVIHFSDSSLMYYVSLLVFIVWKFIYVMITLFFSIAVASSLTRKGGVWIGILIFFLLQNVLGWLSEFLFGDDTAFSGPVASFSVIDYTGFTFSQGHHAWVWGAFAFEVVAAVLILYATVYLIDRKVEV